MISIIIPHHKESKEQMYALLESLDSQRNIVWGEDYEIIIVNDNQEGVIRSFDEFPNIRDHIAQYDNPREGYPGPSRQIGIDHCNGEFVMFCDADDQLYTATALWEMLQAANPDYDLLNFRFMGERKVEKGRYQYYIEPSSSVWLFGKLVRKGFLLERGIRFADDVRWHEDTFFNQAVLLCKPRTKSHSNIVYLWRYNPDSVTRVNGHAYAIETLPEFIGVYDKVVQWYTARGKEFPKSTHINLITSIYIQCNSQNSLKYIYLKDIEEALAKYILKYHCVLYMKTPEGSRQIIQTIHDIGGRYNFIPEEGFTEFIRRILAEHKEIL